MSADSHARQISPSLLLSCENHQALYYYTIKCVISDLIVFKTSLTFFIVRKIYNNHKISHKKTRYLRQKRQRHVEYIETEKYISHNNTDIAFLSHLGLGAVHLEMWVLQHLQHPNFLQV